MIVVDQPVDFQQAFFVLVEIRRRKRSRVEAVIIIQNCPYGIDIGLRHTGNCLNRLSIGGDVRLELLVVREEEQPVPDNWSAERKSVRFFIEICDVDIHAIRFVSR